MLFQERHAFKAKLRDFKIKLHLQTKEEGKAVIKVVNHYFLNDVCKLIFVTRLSKLFKFNKDYIISLTGTFTLKLLQWCMTFSFLLRNK